MRLLLLALLAAGTDAGVQPFAPGESLTYEVTALGFGAGTLRMQVSAPAPMDGISTWPIAVDIRSKGAFDQIFPLRDHDATWWDPVAGHAVANRLSASEGGHRYEYEMHFHRSVPGPDGGIAVDVDHREEGKRETQVRSLDPDVENFLAAIYWLRLRPLLPDERDSVPVVMGENRWTLVSTVVGRETIESGAGSHPCVHVRLSVQFSGKMGNKRDLEAWFTDDPRHVPVLLDSELFIGHLKMRLAQVGDGGV
jgi:hypothetical protein